MASVARGYVERKRRQRETAAQIRMASVARGFIERKRRQRETSASTVLQTCWRGYNARKALESSRAARRCLEGRRATKLQAGVATVYCRLTAVILLLLVAATPSYSGRQALPLLLEGIFFDMV